MSRSGLGSELEFPPGFDEPYQPPPQPNLLGSQSTFPPPPNPFPSPHQSHPTEIISRYDALLSPTTSLASASTNTSKKHRGRPHGSRNQNYHMIEASGMEISSLMSHMIMVNTGEDVLEKIMAFTRSLSKNVIIISTNGTISKVRFSQSSSPVETVTYKGQFEILSLKGSLFIEANESEQKRVGEIRGSFASSSNGRVFGGKIDGVLIAASPIQIILGSFFSDGGEEVEYGLKEPPPKDSRNFPSMVHLGQD